MIVEYIRYLIPAEQAVQFEDAYRQAGAILTADEHCLRHEISRGVENPDRYVVRIEWDSVEGHEQGFRESAAFGEFFGIVKPFFAAIEEENSFIAVEEWRDRAALDRHFGEPHLHRFTERLLEVVSDRPEIAIHEVSATSGFPG